MKPTHISRELEEKMKGITHFRLLFTDVIGQLKEMKITGSEIREVLQHGQGFDGSSVEGFVRLEESDLMAHPRHASFRVLPPEISGNGQSVGIFFCDIKTPEGRPFRGDPRQCLKRIIRKAKALGYTFYTGPELEFFIFPDRNTPKPLDRKGYFDTTSGGPGNTILDEMVDALNSIGIEIECSHHEVAPSQFEIDPKYQDGLTAADQIMLTRWVIEQVAEKHGVCATFMPKPIFGENGSGMHVHLSLFKGDRNAFFNGRHKFNLSLLARRFTAGLLTHVKEFTLITNQNVNSYKRLVPGFEAPVYVSWGRRNRSSLIRVPRYREGHEEATRVELRSPDPACNPYLAFAVMLAAGLDGVNQQLRLGKPIEGNIFKMSDAEKRKLGITVLPGTLQEAIIAAEGSSFLKDVLGDHILTALLNNKRREWGDYNTQVTQWETDHIMSRT